ncbi:MAG TPA: L,D-transpeptidase family protein [Rudaea sp.]
MSVLRRLAFLATLALAACATQPTPQRAAAWSEARQLVLVTIADWNDHTGTLRAFERDANGWHAHGEPVAVVIGRNGAAWGIGLHPVQAGLQKKEGDGRSPAGVFAIGTAFGYAASEPTGLPFLALQSDDYCIDVDRSPLYNRIVSEHTVGADAVKGSSEPMRRDLHAHGDAAYKIGFVIEHNPHAVAGAGSCIFAHLWKSANSSTAGCTAMTEDAMRQLLAWLKPQARPVFVLLPRSEYVRVREAWRLPL